ncbi:MAG: phenylalanine--tRNA ligase subunit alpha [Leptolyngbyaceae cyanobacterium CSU_1_4]|nr:phenylalanine--tRNA ligase subunit alpha [Leptolyngbyaceae cyanobacterium CSU_1_4]
MLNVDKNQLTGKQRQVVQLLQPHSQIPSLHRFCQQHDLDFNFVKGFLLGGTLDEWVQVRALPNETWVPTLKGESGEVTGFPLAEKLLQGCNQLEQLQAQLGLAFRLHYGALRKENAVDMGLHAGGKIIEVLEPTVLESFRRRQAALQNLTEANATDRQWLAEQGLIMQSGEMDYRLAIAPTLQDWVIKPLITNLTTDLLISGKWQDVELKPYNIHDDVPDIAYGRATVLTECIQRIRNIFLGMGFDEMSGCIVESAFWNFDVLFTPQDHPAREIQDTFYLANPGTLPLPDRQLVEQVKQVHEQSYGDEWSEAEASQAILRAHTTPSTARRLYQAQGQNGKYFSIDKVFRNENVDRTHLAEFHQIEGVVIGELLSVRTLIGYLTYFYEQLGFQQLKFKPTYNPYTEPSLEVYAYHPPSQKYLEVGNSGLFRPEMLEPLGCGGKSTIAWGLGLERIAMILYDVDKLSNLVGPDIRLHSP